jgi:hypothetical protein
MIRSAGTRRSRPARARTAVAALAALAALVTTAVPSAAAAHTAAAPSFDALGGIVRLVAPRGSTSPFPAARVVRELPGGTVAIDVPVARAAEAWSGLAARFGPSRIRPDVTLRAIADHVPTDPLWPEAWGPARVGMPAAWGVSLGAPDVVVAVLDTGVDPVPDLAGALLPGRNIRTGGDDTSDPEGHGTVVAQVAAARIDNGVGAAGVCPRCSVLPVTIADAEGKARSTDIASGIVWAVDHGATVVNVSYAGAASPDVLAEVRWAVAYARSAGVSVVAGAGNDGTETPNQPAALPGVLAVAWTDAADALDPDSSFGPWVDIAAPGVAATQVDATRWLESSGTSVSSPMVAGALALLAAAAPSSTMAEREAAVLATAAPVSPAGAIAGGRLDVPAAIAALGPKVVPPAQAADGSPVVAFASPGRAVTFTRGTTATVAWTETLAAGETVASRTVTQQSAAVVDGSCDAGSWTPDGDPQPADAATFTAASLADGTCYRWTVDLVDAPGRATSATSRIVFVDRRKPTIRAVLPTKLTRTTKRTIVFRWSLADGSAGSGVRRDLTIVTYEGRVAGTTCTGWRTWRTTKVPAGTTEDAYTATGAICIRIRITAVDAAGNATTTTLPAYLHR